MKIYQFYYVLDFENWAWYRPGSGKMLPEDIDPSLCTHIMYGFATLDQDTLLLKTYDTWADIDNSKSPRVHLNKCITTMFGILKVSSYFILGFLSIFCRILREDN